MSELERKHTPLPWISKENMIYGEFDDTGQTIAYVRGDNQEANADFIVRACNYHYDLLAGCKLLILWGEVVQQDCGPIPWPVGIEEIRDAIAKATKQE